MSNFQRLICFGYRNDYLTIVNEESPDSAIWTRTWRVLTGDVHFILMRCKQTWNKSLSQ
jgi:hypothetical protein